MVNLMLGDCLERMKEIPDGSVDLILCDLPYGTTQCKWDSVIPMSELWREYKRVLKPFGIVVLFGAQPFTTTLIASNIDMYKYSWVWEKNKAANHIAIKYQPLKFHEDIIVFTESGVNTRATNPIKYNPQGVEWKDETKVRKTAHAKSGTFIYNSLKEGAYKIQGTNYPRSILKYDVPNGESRFHPTQKPVDLCEYLVRTYTNEGDVVLDNCMGSGTTGVACINTGRNFIGIEMDETYFNIAKTRIESAAQQLED